MVFGKRECAAMSNLQCYHRGKNRIFAKYCPARFLSTCTSLATARITGGYEIFHFTTTANAKLSTFAICKPMPENTTMRYKLATRTLVAALLLLLPFTGYCQEGRTSYDFLNITPSAHAYALGGNNISIIEEDITLINNNPALLGPEMDMKWGINYMMYVAGIHFAGTTFGIATSERGALAAGIQYYGYGSMPLTDETGQVLGNFNPQDIQIQCAYSHDIYEGLRGGAMLKFVYSNYEQYTAMALAVDLGLNYYNSEKEYSLSLVARNLGGQLKRYANVYGNLPWDICFGYSQILNNTPVRISITAHDLWRWKIPYPTTTDNGEGIVTNDKFFEHFFRHLIFGVEYLFSNNFYLGIGYNYKTASDMRTDNRYFLSGFSIGGGIKVKMFSLDVAVASHHVSGTTLMLNLTTSIGDFLNRR